MSKHRTSQLLTTLVTMSAAIAAFAGTGQESGHASADSRANACNTAIFAAKQNMPRRAQMVQSQCECDQQRNALGRIDCYATIIWRTDD